MRRFRRKPNFSRVNGRRGVLGVLPHSEAPKSGSKSQFRLSAGQCGELCDAILAACRLHHGQFDKGGEPYFLHCLRVMIRVGEGVFVDENERLTACIAAVLHDAIEDCGEAGFETVRDFGDEVLCVVGILTRQLGESYLDYIRRASFSPMAARIKIADLEDNLDARRMALAEQNGHCMSERRQRYYAALEFLRQPAK